MNNMYLRGKYTISTRNGIVHQILAHLLLEQELNFTENHEPMWLILYI